MTAFNIVRFKVKAGMEEAFLDAHRSISGEWPGMRHANIIKTGERRYCIIAEWASMEALDGMSVVLRGWSALTLARMS